MTRWRADLALIGATMIWGLTFPVVHDITQGYPPMSLLLLRFVLGTGAMLALMGVRRESSPPIGRRGWQVALILGALLFLSFVLQTIGVKLTTPARGGFFTGLNVLFVPPIAFFIMRQRPTLQAILGLAVALVGMAIMSFSRNEAQPATVFEGDMLVLACALTFAVHVVLVSAIANTLPAMKMNAAQLAIAAVLALIFALREGLAMPTAEVWLGVLFLGIVATGLLFGIQLAVQRHTTPTHAALIFALEPVFAALFSVLLKDELITREMWIGGGLMLLGVGLAELPLGWLRRKQVVKLEGEL